MQAETFVKVLGADFYTGVPDSQLKALCNYLMNTYGIDPKHHVIGANEGNCAALAARLSSGNRKSTGGLYAEFRGRKYHQSGGIFAQ